MHKVVIPFYFWLVSVCIGLLHVGSCYAVPSPQRINIVTEVDWKDQGGSNTAKLSKLVLEQMGYNVNLSFVPWARALKMTNEGSYDGIAGIFYKPERAAHLAFTDPVTQTDILLFVKRTKNIRFNGDLASLKKMDLGVVRNYTYGRLFEDANYLSKVEVLKPEHNIGMLLLGRVDAIVASEKSVFNLLSTHYPDKVGMIKPLYPAINTQKVFFAFSKRKENYKSLVIEFNQTLKRLKSSE